ncbi:hypothetical protein A6V39_02355 [Candidatus Mycoplasma haematobovis]|uniref:Uncharacterized protein n=1 Tax=Candidatus Mycoplasma haematobovis TaxID=432608 RepID=A0A1A9QCT0_9MOLU|nr:hypothetical protein A6V39_02355 [Candidatus Mycoplasma haematobovis]
MVQNKLLKGDWGKEERSIFLGLKDIKAFLDCLIINTTNWKIKNKVIELRERDNYYFDSKLLLLFIEAIYGI